MRHICDLPETALKGIQQFAVGRRVLGFNQYGCVSRAWRAASHAWDWEPLRLCLDLDELEQQQLQGAIVWFTKYGYQVQYLSILCFETRTFPVLQQLWLAPESLRSLTRLEVDGEDTLVNLAPLLAQLAQLQHLKASIALREEGAARRGVFCTDDAQQPLAAVPVLQRLCPWLRSLHLVIYSNCAWMDPRLSQLLPCGLEQLQLEVDLAGESPRLDPASLAGCTAIKQLTLKGVDLERCLALADLSSLQTIRLVDVVADEALLLQLKGQLVQNTASIDLFWDDARTVGQLTALTALTISLDDDSEPLSEYGLTSLRALRHLAVVQLDMEEDAGNPQLSILLQQLAGLPQLRDLRLAGMCPQQAAEAGVGALKQLTGLYISGLVSVVTVEKEGLLDNMLRQLTGLQRLEVHPALVTTVSQPWWTSLTALTQLEVVQSLPPRACPGGGGVNSVQAALLAGSVPASLRHLVYKTQLADEEFVACPAYTVEVSTLPGVMVTSWQLPLQRMVEEVALPGTPCPWLPGVWEVAEDN